VGSTATSAGDKYRISLELQVKVETVRQDAVKIKITVDPRIGHDGWLATALSALDEHSERKNRRKQKRNEIASLRNLDQELDREIKGLERQIDAERKKSEKEQTSLAGLQSDVQDRHSKSKHIKQFLTLVDGFTSDKGKAELCYCVYSIVNGNRVCLLRRDPRQTGSQKTK
jgi:hypothetical protein